MYKKVIAKASSLYVNNSYSGERIEEKIQRIVNNNEPIKDGAPLVYTDRKDGVKPEYDIRTDRMEIAVDAMDKVAAANIAKRKSIGDLAKEGMKKEGEVVGAKPIEGTAGESGAGESGK